MHKIPPFRNGPVDGLLEDLTARPSTLLSLYSSIMEQLLPYPILHDAYKNNGFTVPMHNINFGIDINRDANP